MQHVMLDLYHCNAALLVDRAFLYSILDEYPDFIGMEKASPVDLRNIKTSNPLDDGMSGFIIIATSHVSLHAWPPYGMVNLDIFSCEPFDVDDVARFACEKFQTQDIEIHAVERATRSPRVVYAARDVLVGGGAGELVEGGTGELVEGGTGDHKGRPYYTLLM